MKKVLSLIGIVLATQSFAQIVETILTDPSVTDGMCTDAGGNVYTSSGGLEGTVIGKYEAATGLFFPAEITGLVGPTDVEFLNDSVLVITNYDIDAISAYNFNSGVLSTIATGLDGPGGIEADEEGFVYVTNWGGAPEYAGHTITKISPTGESWTYIDSDLLYRPQAITFNHEGQLVVHSNSKLYKINEADSTLEFWTDLSAGIGNMVFNESDSCIYGAANSAHQILKIDTAGNVSVFAGSSSGSEDGDIADAKFQNPLGLTFSPDEDTLYIAEAGAAQRLRRIIMSAYTDLEDLDFSTEEYQLYPNPLPSGQSLTFSSGQNIVDQISIYNEAGELVHTYFPNGSNAIPATVFQTETSGIFMVILRDSTGKEFVRKIVIE